MTRMTAPRAGARLALYAVAALAVACGGTSGTRSPHGGSATPTPCPAAEASGCATAPAANPSPSAPSLRDELRDHFPGHPGVDADRRLRGRVGDLRLLR